MQTMHESVPARYRYDWGYFLDWCRAYGHDPLPCDARIVARFVATESGVARGTLRRRVAAINAAHVRAGLPAPGTATAVRRLLSVCTVDRRAAPLALPALPVRGWPGGLTGRRDALLVYLVCIGGIGAAAVGKLQRSDLSMVDRSVVVGGGHGLELPVSATNPFGIVPVWRRWAKIQSALDRARTPASLILALDNAPSVNPAGTPILQAPPPPAVDGALFPAFRAGMQLKAIDRKVGLSAQEVREVLRGRMSNARSIIREEDEDSADESAGQDTFSDGTAPSENPPTPVLTADYYEAGMAKRRRAAKQLSGLDEVYSSVQDRASELADQLAALLDVVDGG